MNSFFVYNSSYINTIMQTAMDRLRLFTDNGQLTLFFVYDGRIYGTEESGRVTFAELKDPEGQKEDKKYLFFTAVDLAKIANNETLKKSFGLKELKDIKVIENVDEARKMAISLCDD